MKRLYLLVCSIILFNICFSAQSISACANGYWSSASTWNLNRVPQIGDTIMIPLGKTVIIDDDENFQGFVYLKIFGKLIFQENNSTLNVDAPSIIAVFPDAMILGNGSPSQKIRYDNSIIFKGNNSVLGPQMATATSNGFTPFAFSPLPVKFIDFTVTLQNKNVLIQWSTSEEMNAAIYEVERSTNGVNWNTIAYVAAIGNSSVVNKYAFTDKTLSSNLAYYRIKEVDVDGRTAFTSVKSIMADDRSGISDIQIASASNKLLLQFPQPIRGKVTVRFVSLSGQVVDQQMINDPAGQVILNSKFSGNYIISISNGQNINASKQVIL